MYIPYLNEMLFVAIFGAKVLVSFSWLPIFHSYIGRGIRNFVKSLFFFFFFFAPQIILSINLTLPTTNFTSLLSEMSN